jgi:hypothetical protein
MHLGLCLRPSYLVLMLTLLKYLSTNFIVEWLLTGVPNPPAQVSGSRTSSMEADGGYTPPQESSGRTSTTEYIVGWLTGVADLSPLLPQKSRSRTSSMEADRDYRPSDELEEIYGSRRYPPSRRYSPNRWRPTSDGNHSPTWTHRSHSPARTHRSRSYSPVRTCRSRSYSSTRTHRSGSYSPVRTRRSRSYSPGTRKYSGGPRSPRVLRRRRSTGEVRSSGDDTSQDSDSHEGKHEVSFTPPRQGLAKPQAQPGSWVESSSLGPVDAPTTSVSENGTLSTPPSSSCVEH